MNTSVSKILENTTDATILRNAAKIMSAGNRKMEISFIKKDGTKRTGIFSCATNWNTMNGLGVTQTGLKMLNTKVSNGIATVTEWLGDGCFRPRSLNLGTITGIKILPLR